jgi:hypothetical protein
MNDSTGAPRQFGSLERWTIALLTLSVVLSVFAWIPAVICLFSSKCWTLQEKFVGLLSPIALLLLVAVAISGTADVQNWILFPVVLTFSGVAQAIYFYLAGRPIRDQLATA